MLCVGSHQSLYTRSDAANFSYRKEIESWNDKVAFINFYIKLRVESCLVYRIWKLFWKVSLSHNSRHPPWQASSFAYKLFCRQIKKCFEIDVLSLCSLLARGEPCLWIIPFTIPRRLRKVFITSKLLIYAPAPMFTLSGEKNGESSPRSGMTSEWDDVRHKCLLMIALKRCFMRMPNPSSYP